MGTQADPYAGLTELAANLTPGQTGCIVPGSTFQPDESFIGPAQSGTPQAKKVIRSGPGARATILGTVGIEASDIVFRDLIFRPVGANTGRLLAVFGDRVEFRHNDISHPWNICVQIGRGQSTGGQNTLIAADDVLFDRNEVHHCGNLMGEDVTGSGWHAFYVQEGSGIRILNNVIYQGGYRGLQVYPNAKGAEIAYNVFDGSGSNLNLGHLVLDGTLYIAENTDIHHNIISNARLSPAPNKNPAQIHGYMPNDGNTRGNVVRNNCMWYDDPLLQADMSKQFSGYGYSQFDNVFGDPGYANRAAFDFSRPPGGPCAAMGPQPEAGSQPSLGVTLVRTTAQPRVGQPLAFSSTIGNTGGAAATGVDFVYTLDEAFDSVTATPAKGVCLPANGFNDVHCQIGTLAPGETVSVDIGVTPSSQGNKYMIGVGYADNAVSASTGNVWTQVEPAAVGPALIATLARNAPNGTVGQSLTFDASIGNQGGQAAADAQLVLSVDPSFASAVATPTKGNCTPPNGTFDMTCQIGTLAPGETVSVEIVTTPSAAGNKYLAGVGYASNAASSATGTLWTEVLPGVSSPGAVAADFDGDGDSDVAVFRPAGNGWFVQGGPTTSWGAPGDIPVPGDYDGDGSVDVAVFRPSDRTWYVQGGLSTQWGIAGDIPVPADFNGDGVTDIAVFRPSDQTWYAQPSPSFPAGLATQWGVTGDVPVPVDFNGDGLDEVAVYRPSDQTWYSQGSETSTGLATQWGISGDIPIPVDFDGDGDAEVAVYRPTDQTWYVQGGIATQWGKPGDVAVPGDYDGDGDADVAVFRPSDQTWYVQGGLSTQWGAAGDVPVIVPYATRLMY